MEKKVEGFLDARMSRTSHGARVVSKSWSLRSKPWVITIIALVLWCALTPALIHHDLMGTNFLLIPIVMGLVVAFRPLRPLTAAWSTLLVSALNLVIGPLSNRMAGSDNDINPIDMATFVWLGLGSAAAVALIAVLRLRIWRTLKLHQAVHANAKELNTPGLSAELQKLFALREAGVLTEDEFKLAKRKLLGP
ncbi:MAG: SHOCT domain-containing protein [Flavobacteriales bacterium]